MAQWPEGGTQGQRAQRPECEKKLLFPSVLQQLLNSKKLQPFSHKRFVSGIAMLMAQWPESGAMARRWHAGPEGAKARVSNIPFQSD